MMEKKRDLEREIEKLQKDLKDYLKLVPLLEVTEEQKERVINMFLDDILRRQEKLKKLE